MLIYIANTHGGAVILGIDDSKRPVLLSASDKNDKLRNGEDCFARDVLDVAFKPESKNWKCFKETYSLDNKVFYNLLEYKFMDYQSNRVVLIIVNPVQKNDDLILVEEIHKGREILLTRALGEIGKVNEEFKSIVISNYKMSRKPEQDKYDQLYQQFLNNLQNSGDKIISQSDYCITNNLPQRNFKMFIGREEEIKKILFLLSGRTFLVSITGIGGVGKSALASEIGYICMEQKLFDYVVWSSAKTKFFFGTKLSPVLKAKTNLEDIIGDILQVCDKEMSNNLPDFQTQLNRVIKILSEKKVLLIIDNMETIEDENLYSFLINIPGQSKAIVTDRRSFQESSPVHLKAMTNTDTINLIKEQASIKEISFSDEQVKLLAEEIGGVPLAIIWAISLISSTEIDPEDVIRRLRKVKEDCPLEFIFKESFNYVTDLSKNILALLSYVDAPVMGKTLSYVLDQEEDLIKDSLANLIEFALISKNDPNFSCNPISCNKSMIQCNYSILPLTKDFVNKYFEYDRIHFFNRLSEYLLNMIFNNEENPDWPSVDTINAIENQKEIFIWLIEQSIELKKLDLAFKLIRPIAYSLGIRGYHDIRYRLGLLLYHEALKVESFEEASRNLISNVAWVNFNWYKFDECLNDLIEGKRLALLAGNQKLVGIAIRTIALVNKENGFHQKAKSGLEEALNIFKSINDLYFVSITLGSLASLSRDLKEYEKAEEFLAKALDVSRQLKNADELTSIFLQKLTKILINKKKLSDAEKYNQEALTILNRLNRPVGKAHCLHNIALMYEIKNEIEDAFIYISQAYDLFSNYGSREEIQNDYNRILGKIQNNDNV